MSQAVEPPPPESSVRTREELKKIAVYQLGVCVCILVYLLGIVGMLTMKSVIAPFAYLLLPVPIVFAVFVFLLAINLYGKGVGIFMGILTLIPFVGLFVLLVVNGQATRLLKAHGLKVGLLGADMKQFNE
jgi:hypothetical protein